MNREDIKSLLTNWTRHKTYDARTFTDLCELALDALDTWEPIRKDIEALRAENESLRAALQWIIEFCDRDEVELNTIQSHARRALERKPE